MKELYFTKQNIDLFSKNMIKEIKSSKIIKKSFDLSNSALLIIDMQKYFTDNLSHAFVPSSQAIILKIKELTGLFLCKKRPIIFTRHIDKKYKNNMLLKWWHHTINKNDNLSHIDERVFIEKSPVIIKTQYDAFYKTNLDSVLKKYKVKRVFISGVVANLCCETTARSSFVRGYEVYFGVDTTAAYCFKHHMATLINISMGFGVPFIVEDVLNAN